jgi:alanyl-tRNA synthetase
MESFTSAVADSERLKALAARLNAPLAELEKKLEAALTHQKALEKQLAALKQRQAGATAAELLEKVRRAGLRAPAIIEALDEADGDDLQAVADNLKPRFEGVIVLAGVSNGAVALVATVSPKFTKDVQAGKLIQGIAPLLGGKGGGRPDNARGGGHDAAKVPEALREAERLLAG